jgi:hypothetical protein
MYFELSFDLKQISRELATGNFSTFLTVVFSSKRNREAAR